jgi:hypothetical protein
MKISKQDALVWFRFFAELPEDEELTPNQQEIVYATMAQIEAAVEKRREELKAQIPGLKSLEGRTLYVGEDSRFPRGCRSCLLGTGLSAVRKTNKCNIQCKFCYNYGELDQIPPIGEGLWEIGGTKFYEQDIDLLLSIHMNEYRVRSESGPQVFYRAGNEGGRLLAGCLQEALITRLTPKKQRTAMAGDYFILQLEAPSALVECGFISNAEEERLLRSADYQTRLAEAIAEGVVLFFSLSVAP